MATSKSAVSGEMRTSPLPSTSMVRTANESALVCADAADTSIGATIARVTAAARSISFMTFTLGARGTKLIRADIIRRLYQLTIIKVVTQDEWRKNKQNRMTRR